jgi:precorrin-3B synthase
VTIRADADRCPGVLRPHQAADGAVLRIRIPGGRITAAELQALSAATVDFADGDVQLTSRANLQLRGVRTTGDGSAVAGLVDALAGAGLLPHPTHERVRNIVCSPLTGLVGGLADLRPVVAELDVALCARPDLAALPGPFLFVLDDGRGDVGVARADVGILALSADLARVWVGGVPGPEVPLAASVATMIGLGEEFRMRSAVTERVCWHVRELPGGGSALLGTSAEPADPRPGEVAPLGALTSGDGRVVLSVLAPLGRLTASQVGALAEAAVTAALVVTPWRGVLVPDVEEDDASSVLAGLTATGLIADDRSPWRGVTACPGTRCARGAGDTGALARQVVAASPRSAQLPVHIVACARACGRPSRQHLLAVVGRQRVEICCDEGTVGTSVQQASAVIAATRRVAQR